MIETLSHVYSSESTQRELSNEYHEWQSLDVFQKSLHPIALAEGSLSIGRVKHVSELPSFNDVIFCSIEIYYINIRLIKVPTDETFVKHLSPYSCFAVP